MMIRDLVKAYFAGVIDREFLDKLYDLLDCPLSLLHNKYLSDGGEERERKILIGIVYSIVSFT